MRGNTVTKTDRIRDLATWNEGAPFSEEKVLETQRQLSRTGAFQRVEVRPEAGGSRRSGAQRPDRGSGGAAALAPVRFRLSVPAGAGENQNDPFVLGGISTRNLFGGMRSAGLEAQIALSGRYRVQASFRDPFLFGQDYPSLRFSSPASRRSGPSTSSASVGSTRCGTFSGVPAHSCASSTRAIRPTNHERLSPIDLEEFPRLDQPIKEAAVGTAFLYDRRDDPINPHRGYYTSLAGKYAFPCSAAEAQFTKFAAQGVYFQPLGKAVLEGPAASAASSPTANAQILVPVAERFFVGGRSTERAFETDLLGIPGTFGRPGSRRRPSTTRPWQLRKSVTPGEGNCATAYPTARRPFDCTQGPSIIGGNGFLSINAELRLPIVGNLGGSIFYDAAQVWKSFSSLGWRFEGDDGLRQAVGAGLWFMLPIGPLRAEYAWKVTRRTIPSRILDVTDPRTRWTGGSSRIDDAGGRRPVLRLDRIPFCCQARARRHARRRARERAFQARERRRRASGSSCVDPERPVKGASASASRQGSEGSPPSRRACASLSVRKASNQVCRWRRRVAASDERARACAIARGHTELLQRLPQQVDPEKGAGRRERRDRALRVAAGGREAIERLEPGREVRENERVVKAEIGKGALRFRSGPEGPGPCRRGRGPRGGPRATEALPPAARSGRPWRACRARRSPRRRSSSGTRAPSRRNRPGWRGSFPCSGRRRASRPTRGPARSSAGRSRTAARPAPGPGRSSNRCSKK